MRKINDSLKSNSQKKRGEQNSFNKQKINEQQL